MAVTALAPHQRLDDFRLSERCAQDQVAEAISLHLYSRHYDDLPRELRSRVEGAALRAVRSPQTAWVETAMVRAHQTLDRAMAHEMGLSYAQQSVARRQALASIGVQAVLGALIAVFELENPFTGPGDALRVYDAAAAAQQEVR